MNKFILRLVMLFSGLWKNMGADTEQLRAILDTKLKIDDRKPLNFGRRRPKAQSKYNSLLSMLFSFFAGFVYIYPLVAFNDPIFSLWAYFSTFLFLLTFSLITDFSNVIVDTSDKLILLPRPINDQTLFLSRIIHIFIYLVRVVFPMSLPGWIIIGLDRGWQAALLFPLPLLMMVFVALFTVNAFYLAILRFTKPGKFKDVIGSLQIAFSIVVFAVFYLMQGITRTSAVRNIDISQYSWIQFTPPYWLASCYSWLGVKGTFSNAGWFSILSIVFPLFAIWATVKWLAPSFTKQLGSIDTVDVEESSGASRKMIKRGTYNRLANVFNYSDAAKSGFIITWLQTGRSRTFKMRVYPMLAYVPVYFVYMLLMTDQPFVELWNELPETNMHLFPLYMCALAMVQALNYISMSDQYKAAWVYYSAPIETPGEILAGSFKALWIKYFLPFISIIGLFVVWIWGPRAVWDVLLAMVNVSVFAICVLRLSHRIFPFSMAEQMKEKGGKGLVRVLFTFVLMGVFGFSHYLLILAGFLWLKILVLILSSIFFWMVWESCKATDWKSMRAAEA
ncbi:hypothetical protein [Polluticoccus soli]|uniref:hypothetical protein n=1 Tax=Polluticoccus soli TaxID=3034150 RepID=UPI0023E23257|nr:hypothetical protein [Flavipsychrobacter sp. JY13-12]